MRPLNGYSIARESIPDQVARAILDFLRNEGYQAGDRIPSTKVLCEQFGVGYPTLREALQQLETLGFIRVRHGAGIFVENLEERLFVANPMEQRLSPKALVDLIQARKAIEPAAASLAAMWASEEEINEMRACLETSREHLSDDSKLSRSNMNFHRLVAKASGNEVFEQLMTILTGFYYREQEAILVIYDAREKDHEEHWAIFQAIERGDPMEAGRLMQSHLEGVEQALKERGWIKP